MIKNDARTMFAWKPAPFGSIRKAPNHEGQRWPRYQRRAHRTAKRRDWTHDEVEHLTTLLDAGHDYTTIGRRLGRTRVAVQIKVKRLHSAMTKRPTVLTAREVARLLGKGCAKSVVWWIEAGWLVGNARRTIGRTERRIWAVQWGDLMTFLREPRFWMAWSPERITDADLRVEMTALRAGQPCWLTQGEVARRCHVSIEAVGQWITKGFLASQRYGNHYIWSADLDGWAPPCQRPRIRPTYVPPSDEPGWMRLVDVAARCHVDRMSPQRWVRSGRLAATRTRKCYWVRERDLEMFLAAQRAT